jgi:hypothetical protein
MVYSEGGHATPHSRQTRRTVCLSTGL